MLTIESLWVPWDDMGLAMNTQLYGIHAAANGIGQGRAQAVVYPLFVSADSVVRLRCAAIV